MPVKSQHGVLILKNETACRDCRKKLTENPIQYTMIKHNLMNLTSHTLQIQCNKRVIIFVYLISKVTQKEILLVY